MTPAVESVRDFRPYRCQEAPGCSGQGAVYLAAGTVSAAVWMSWATSSGWETIATWLEAISMVVAPIRAANIRSASGGSAWSPVATRYHDGSVFQAGTP